MSRILPFRFRDGTWPPIRPVDRRTQARSPLERVGCFLASAIITGAVACLINTDLQENCLLIGSISTAKGQHGCWKLQELSEVCLGTGSEVRYTLSRRARHIQLVAGEAIVNVHPDIRPFEVLSGEAVIRDLSTRFYVKRGSSDIVTVLEGKVKAMAPVDNQLRRAFDVGEPALGWETALELQQLDQAEVDGRTGMLHKRPALTNQQLSRLLAWQRGRLDLTDMSLVDALAEISRYQPISKFNIPEELRGLKVPGGEVDPTNLMNFLTMIGALRGIQYSLTQGADGQTIVNLTRPQKPASHRKHAGHP
jgi:ferric-dicitrate binding protein FerR (iron transport regulator)